MNPGVAAIHLGNGVPAAEVRARILGDALTCRLPDVGRGSPNRFLYVDPAKPADEEPAGSEAREAYAMSLAMFEFWMDVQDFRSEPEPSILVEMGTRIHKHFVAHEMMRRYNPTSEPHHPSLIPGFLHLLPLVSR